jgi:serine phosphatase RsbU (regulator of sigma subunit)/pSer/pThr/pTyr-binding forkhead associated (FHA) protein
MAHLVIRKGANPGHRLALDKDTIILGRSPDCDIPIPSPSISRQHARLLCVQDKWFIEDMLSRNGTAVNNLPIRSRVQLKRNDRIRICDFEAIFQDAPLTATVSYELVAPGPDLESEDIESSSTLTAIATHGHKVLDIQPPENLRVILDVSNTLSTTLELDQLLPKIADSVFGVYKHAERCFLILQDESTGNLSKEVTRTRAPQGEQNARFSRSIVRECLSTQRAYLSEDVAGKGSDAGSADLALRSVMCTPFFSSASKPFGAIQLDTRDQANKFTTHDLKLLVGLANQASIALQNALVYQEMQKREQIERDLELAAQVQKSILPDRAPELPGYQFYNHYASALEVGGDYFDFIPLSAQRLAITLGDVAGKSVPAAILMAKLSADVRSCLLTEADPAAAITKLNGMLYANLRRTDRWITFTAALLDAARHAVTLVNAGHCAPLLYRRESNSVSEAIANSDAGVPIGVEESPSYGSRQIQLQPGDCVLLFTDGVLDALNSQNQPFRLSGVYHSLQSGGPYTPQSLGERVVKAVEQHAAGHSQYDDITLVSFGRIV